MTIDRNTPQRKYKLEEAQFSENLITPSLHDRL